MYTITPTPDTNSILNIEPMEEFSTMKQKDWNMSLNSGYHTQTFAIFEYPTVSTSIIVTRDIDIHDIHVQNDTINCWNPPSITTLKIKQ